MTAGIVTFDYATWAGQYPEFDQTVTPGQAQADFNQACLYLDNTPASFVLDASVGGRRETILYQITSHLAQLLQGSPGQPASPLVGQITGATQGSVTLGVAEMKPESAAWWAQTKYGLLAWQALAPYCTALYVPAPQISRGAQSLAGLGWRGW